MTVNFMRAIVVSGVWGGGGGEGAAIHFRHFRVSGMAKLDKRCIVYHDAKLGAKNSFQFQTIYPISGRGCCFYPPLGFFLNISPTA